MSFVAKVDVSACGGVCDLLCLWAKEAQALNFLNGVGGQNVVRVRHCASVVPICAPCKISGLVMKTLVAS